MSWDIFWDINKLWFPIAGIMITGFLVFGAIFLSWWINSDFGLILTIFLALLMGLAATVLYGRQTNEQEAIAER